MAMEIAISTLIKERRNVLARLRDHENIVCDLKTTLSHIDATLFHLGIIRTARKLQRSPWRLGYSIKVSFQGLF